MGEPILTRCFVCHGLVTPAHVEKGLGVPNEYARLFWLHDCGTEHSTRLPWKAYRRFVNRWNDHVEKSKKSYDTEEIGRMVQGFRIDLDAVGTVADIALLWDDQTRHRRWTIPKEAMFR